MVIFLEINLFGILNHLIHQIVGIDYRSFAGFHLTIRQFNHAVGEVNEFFAEGESETVKQDRQHLEVVLLLVAYHIDHLVDRIVLEAELGGTDILGHIDGGAVGAEEQFLVQSVLGEVCPYRTVFAAVERTAG